MAQRTWAFALTFAAALALTTAATEAAEWGTLKGQFILDGTAPAPAKLNINKDQAVCGQHELVDESLLVDANGGIKNILVYIRPARGKKIDVHPDYAASANDKVVLDNLNCRFEPHIVLLRTSQTLALKNSDSVGHNCKLDAFVNTPINVLIPPEATNDQKLTKEERMPVQASCNIHPWMTAFVVVRDDPYMAVSADDGTFEIKNIPAGKYEFQFWQEKAGYLKKIKLGSAGETDNRGRANLEIKAGDNELGKVSVPVAAFK